MIICGIDPGTNILGYSIIQKDIDLKIITYNHIKLTHVQEKVKRLHYFFNEIVKLFSTYNPDCIVIESAFYAKNIQSTITLGQIQGIIIAALSNTNSSFHAYTPREIKKAITGNGNASKQQVAARLNSMFAIQANHEQASISNLSTNTGSLDATDALAISVCHAFRLDHPILLK